MRHMFRGRLLEEDQLKVDKEFNSLDRVSVIVGPDLPQEDVAYVFESDGAFDEFLQDVPYGDKFRELNETAAAAQRLENQDHRETKRRQQEAVMSVTQRLQALSEHTGLSIDSPEFRQRAEGSLLEPPILQAAAVAQEEETTEFLGLFEVLVAYDSFNLGGSWTTLVRTMPNLSWIGWNDRMSSVRSLNLVGGYAMFSEHTWYRGSKLHLVFGPIVSSYPNLDDFSTAPGVGWSDRISSLTFSL